jgi:hypothetical protein
MAKSLPLSPEFLSALAGFLAKANAATAARFAANYPSLEPDILYPDTKGLKFIRIICGSYGGSRSSFCFIDKSNGDILKCAGWNAPAKHPRGNIFSPANGMEAIGPGGHINYL